MVIIILTELQIRCNCFIRAEVHDWHKTQLLNNVKEVVWTMQWWECIHTYCTSGALHKHMHILHSQQNYIYLATKHYGIEYTS